MHTVTHRPPTTISLGNVALLCLLAVLALFAVSSSVMLGVTLPAAYLPGSDAGMPFKGLRIASIPLAQSAYLGIAVYLARRTARPWASVRYALLLQLQATVELIAMLLTFVLITAAYYWFMGAVGEDEIQASMRQSFDQGHDALGLRLLLLATPAAAIIVAAWRLHAVSRAPGALPALIDGSALTRTIAVSGDTDDSQSELVRRLERLTSADMPGLGRLMYGSHPRLTSRRVDGLTIHELAWWTCPMKLRITLHPQGNGVQELRVACLLRGGIYRLHLVATPADLVAQMRYVETHLLQPFTAELARRSAQRQHDALRDQAVEAQLRILQAQIEPHFLFNTLANVRQVYRGSHVEGESMLDHLIAYLRCAMDELRAERSSVSKEMDLAMHYLAIMQIRMGERLSYRFSVPDSLLDQPMPPAMLISLVENAIKHGVANSRHGQITLTATTDGVALRVTVADNGAGMSSVGGTGVGLSNIRQRLEAIYGSRAWLEVGAPEQGGFLATIILPLEERK